MSDMRGACGLYYSFQIRDAASGKIIVPFRRKRAHSFLTVYITWLYLKMVGATTQNRTDTDGVSRALHRKSHIHVATVSGSTVNGLVVGTGTNAVTITDFRLQTKIAHGTSAGQLQYSSCVVNLPTSTATTTSLIMTRDFTNASGSTITIEELGIYAEMNYGASGSSQDNFCIVRDLQTIALTNGQILTLNYEIKTTI